MNSESSRKKRTRESIELKIDPKLLSPQSKKSYKDKMRSRSYRSKLNQNAKTKNEMASAKATIAVLKREIVNLKRKLEQMKNGDVNFDESLHGDASGDVDSDDKTVLSASVGSSDPKDEDFDPQLDSDVGLDTSRLRALMERAGEFKTSFNMLTGHTRAEFDQLARQMKDYIIQTTMNGEPIKISSVAVDEWKTRPHEQLFVTLLWLRWHFTYAFLAFFTSLPVRYVQKIIKRCTAAMARASGRGARQVVAWQRAHCAATSSRSRRQMAMFRVFMDIQRGPRNSHDHANRCRNRCRCLTSTSPMMKRTTPRWWTKMTNRSYLFRAVWDLGHADKARQTLRKH
jgi:hypothetical protein